MSFREVYNNHCMVLTAPDSYAVLCRMEDVLGHGNRWAQDRYITPEGSRCLAGAAEFARSSIDYAKAFLKQAIAEAEPGTTSIEVFNDTRVTYGQVAAVIARAKQLALAAAESPFRHPQPMRALTGEILPPAKGITFGAVASFVAKGVGLSLLAVLDATLD